jgi:hypothetical protein
MELLDTINKLCKPAYVYLVISVIGMIVLILQNMGNNGKYCVGTFNCNVPHNGLVFLGQGLYIALWTWVLHYICRKGYKNLSWVLVLLPFLGFFMTILGLVFLQAKNIIQ